MSRQRQPGLFDVEERATKLTALGDPLVGLTTQIDWEAFRPDLARVHEKDRKSNAGARPFDVVLMFKLLILQQLHNLSDDGIENQVRERLKALELVEVLFARFHEQLARLGYLARAGQIIDATFVEVPRQRNSRDENAAIKAGELPKGWEGTSKPSVGKRMSLRVGRRKNEEKHYGDKDHINADQAHKLIQSVEVTPVSVHDSRVFEALLDQSEDAPGEKRPIYTDSAYRSNEREEDLAEAGIESQICGKRTRGTPLTDAQKASNRPGAGPTRRSSRPGACPLGDGDLPLL